MANSCTRVEVRVTTVLVELTQHCRSESTQCFLSVCLMFAFGRWGPLVQYERTVFPWQVSQLSERWTLHIALISLDLSEKHEHWQQACRPSFPQSVNALVKQPVVSTLMHVILHSDTKWKMNEDITVREITASYKERHRERNSLQCAPFLIIQNMFMGCHFSVLVNIKTCSKHIKNVSWQCGEMGELWVMVMSDQQHWLFVFLQMAWTAGVRVYP